MTTSMLQASNLNAGMGIVRFKPLGAGAGGIEASYLNDTAAVSPTDLPVKFNSTRNEIVVEQKSGRSKLYKYPTRILGDEQNQEDVYREFMTTRVDAFLKGVNVNVMAYGQTGSGKTHTMFGPPGIMQRAGNGEYSSNINEDYGLYPRGLINITNMVNELNRNGDDHMKYILTASAIELGIIGMIDMFSSSESSWEDLMRDSRSAEVHLLKGKHICDMPKVFGQLELRVDGESTANLYRMFRALATRNTEGTSLNDSSSRSHCFAFLNLYAYDSLSSTVRISKFQFVDLAGSERLKAAHNGDTNYRDSNINVIQGLITNYSLMMLSRCVRELVNYRKKGGRGHFSFSSYLVDLVPMLGESMTGEALTAIFVCLSQAPANSIQSSISLEFGEVFSKLRVKPKVRKAVKIRKLIDETTSYVRSAKTVVSGGGNSKYLSVRRAQVRDGQQILEILNTFLNASDK